MKWFQCILKKTFFSNQFFILVQKHYILWIFKSIKNDAMMCNKSYSIRDMIVWMVNFPESSHESAELFLSLHNGYHHPIPPFLLSFVQSHLMFSWLVNTWEWLLLMVCIFDLMSWWVDFILSLKDSVLSERSVFSNFL